LFPSLLESCNHYFHLRARFLQHPFPWVPVISIPRVALDSRTHAHLTHALPTIHTTAFMKPSNTLEYRTHTGHLVAVGNNTVENALRWSSSNTRDYYWESVTQQRQHNYTNAYYACSDSDTNNLESSYFSTTWLSEWVGFNIPSKNYRSFWRRVFPVYHLHRYWQPNKNNKEREHTNKDKNNATQEVGLVNMNISTHNCKCGILSQDL